MMISILTAVWGGRDTRAQAPFVTILASPLDKNLLFYTFDPFFNYWCLSLILHLSSFTVYIILNAISSKTIAFKIYISNIINIIIIIYYY